MIIECGNCGAKYNVDNSKIPAIGIKVRCNKCQHTIFIKKGNAKHGDDKETSVMEEKFEKDKSNSHNLDRNLFTDKQIANIKQSWFMNTELEKARREFLNDCSLVIRIPAVWYMKGNQHSYDCVTLPLPFYADLGFTKKVDDSQMEIVTNEPIFGRGLRDCIPSYLISSDKKGIINPTIRYQFQLYFLHYLDRLFDGTTRYLALLEIEKVLKEINKGQVKIWFQIPGYFNFHINIGLAFSMLIAYLQGGFSIENFNNILDEYRSHVLDSVEEFIFFTRNNVLNNTIRNILAIAWILDYASNGSTSFSSLIGGGNINAIRVHNISYRITRSSDSHYTDDVSRLCPEFNDKYIAQYLNFVIGSMLNKTTSYGMHSGARVLDDEHLIMHIKNGSDIIFGSLLRPLFDRDIPAFTIEKRPGELCICPQIRIAYEASHLEISGPWRRLFEIEKSIGKKNNTFILYSSNSMGGDVGGARLLLPEEYQTTPKFMLDKNLYKETDIQEAIFIQKIAEPNRTISEFFIKHVKRKVYTIKIQDNSSNSPIEHTISERIFTRLVSLLSARLYSDEGWVNKKELYPYSQDQDISAYRKAIEPFGDLLVNEQGQVKLQVDKDIIKVDDSVSRYESEDMRNIAVIVTHCQNKKKHIYKQTISKKSGYDEDFTKNEQALMLALATKAKLIAPFKENSQKIKLSNSCRNCFINTFLVKDAFERRNLPYQTKKWHKMKWRPLLNAFVDIFSTFENQLMELLERASDWDLYIRVKEELGKN